jgi:phosphoribosyl 1,2-cyclic phosphodiesterase
VEVRCGSRLIVLDAGTGIRELGLQLEQQGVTEIDLLLSHAHMDHIQGFPFFTPAYRPGTSIRIHTARIGPDRDLTEPFDTLMGAPHFPVPFRSLAADIRVEQVNGRFQLGDVAISTHPLNHPGGSLSFRLEFGGRSLVYMTDHEPYTDEREEEVRAFLRGADLLIREAQYTPAEYDRHRGWGHGTFDAAVTDAGAAEVKRVALFHHDPQHDDSFLEAQLCELRSRFSSSPLKICVAREGQCVELA